MRKVYLLISAVFAIFACSPARADVIYLVCSGYAHYTTGHKTERDSVALIFDFDRRLVFLKEDAEGLPMTSVSDSRVAWKSPDTPGRLTESEGQFSTVSMSGREFYKYRSGGGGWTNYYENCQRRNPGFSSQSNDPKIICNLSVNGKAVSYHFSAGSDTSFTETLYVVNGKSTSSYAKWLVSNNPGSVTLTYSKDTNYSIEVSNRQAALYKRGQVIGYGSCDLQ